MPPHIRALPIWWHLPFCLAVPRYGCDLTYGSCLNITGGDVYLYDQNGTCVCHPWFTGGNCSTVDTSGDICMIGGGETARVLDLETCTTLRRRLYTCGTVGSGDGLPRECIDAGYDAIQCLESGLLARGDSSTSSSGGGGGGGGGGSSSSSSSSSSSMDSSTGSESEWMLGAARASRQRACDTGVVQQVLDATVAGNEMAAKLPTYECDRLPKSPLGEADGTFGSSAYVDREDASSEQKLYEPNLRGHRSDGWVMAMCAKCMGRPETAVKACRRATTLNTCARSEGIADQAACNLCMDDTIGNTMPSLDKRCSFFRGTCMGSVEKRIRGIVPPNIDVIGKTPYGACWVREACACIRRALHGSLGDWRATWLPYAWRHLSACTVRRDALTFCAFVCAHPPQVACVIVRRTVRTPRAATTIQRRT